jgi:hypothetical protein
MKCAGEFGNYASYAASRSDLVFSMVVYSLIDADYSSKVG